MPRDTGSFLTELSPTKRQRLKGVSIRQLFRSFFGGGGREAAFTLAKQLQRPKTHHFSCFSSYLNVIRSDFGGSQTPDASPFKGDSEARQQDERFIVILLFIHLNS